MRGRRWLVWASRAVALQPKFQDDSAAVRAAADATDDAETRLLEVGRITPVYESLGGARWLRAGSGR